MLYIIIPRYDVESARCNHLNLPLRLESFHSAFVRSFARFDSFFYFILFYLFISSFHIFFCNEISRSRDVDDNSTRSYISIYLPYSHTLYNKVFYGKEVSILFVPKLNFTQIKIDDKEKGQMNGLVQGEST